MNVLDLRREAVSHEITLSDLRRDLARGRYWVLLITVLCAAALGIYGAMRTRLYEASIVVMPVSEEVGGGRLGGLSSLASQFGGLASLAGISLNGGTRREEYIAVLKSELVTQSFIQSRKLLPVLYSDAWDAHAGRWKTDNVRKQPTLWKAYRYFDKDIRQVTEDKSTGLVTMKIKWKDRQEAADWANGLVKLTNAYLRNKAISEAERNIAYLNSEVAKTNIVEIKTSIYALLQQEINSEMVARGREEYALRVIDPAYVPEKPVSFGPITLTIFGLLAGGLGSLIVILVRRIYSQSS